MVWFVHLPVINFFGVSFETIWWHECFVKRNVQRIQLFKYMLNKEIWRNLLFTEDCNEPEQIDIYWRKQWTSRTCSLLHIAMHQEIFSTSTDDNNWSEEVAHYWRLQRANFFIYWKHHWARKAWFLLNIAITQRNFILTAHNWQHWKRVFPSCHCHEIYRVKPVGLKNCNYVWKITIFVNVWNLGQLLEKSIFCQ